MKYLEEGGENYLYFNILGDGNVSDDGLDDENVHEENDIVTFLSERPSSENASNFPTAT